MSKSKGNKSKGSKPKGKTRGYIDESHGKLPDELRGTFEKLLDATSKAQDELGKIHVEGVAGGGLVRVGRTVLGNHTSVKIDESLLEEGTTVIEELVLEAIQSASRKAEQANRKLHEDKVYDHPTVKLVI